MQDLAKGKIIIKSPAKINLHLEVIGKREDGFHELAMIMQNIDLSDFLELEINNEGLIKLETDCSELSISSDNLIVKSANLLRKNSNIEVSAFIDPIGDQINYSNQIGFNFVELHTGKYAELSGSEQYKELQRIIESTHLANDLGLVVNAGHGLNYNNVKKIASINNMNELNIGHSIVARALAIGLEKSVREMKSLITSN